MRFTFFITLAMTSTLLASVSEASNSRKTNLQKNATQLLNRLLKGYDNRLRPGYGGGPTIIRTDFNIRSMGPISELEMTYCVDTYFRQTWDDERLRFTETTRNEMAVHISMLQKIWKPDTYFLNGLGSYLHTITEPNKLLRIMKNGTILYSMRLTIKASCPMYLQYFPVDQQACPLVIGSYAYTSDQVVYVWKSGNLNSIKTSEDMRLSQFDLTETPAWNQTIRNSFGEFSTLVVHFKLSRHMGYFLIQVYIPCALIVIISWVSFWINREATPDRVGLGITTVLTLTTTSMDSRNDLPKVEYATALDWFIQICFAFVIGSMLQYAAVHYFTKIGSGEFEDVSSDEEEAEEDAAAAAADDDAMWETEDEMEVKSPQLLSLQTTEKIRCWRCSAENLSKPSSFNNHSTCPHLNNDLQFQRLRNLPADQHSAVAKDNAAEAEGMRKMKASQPAAEPPKYTFWFKLVKCLQSNSKYRKLMRKTANKNGQNSVSRIDTVSRILFPVAFIFVIAIYIVTYSTKKPIKHHAPNIHH